MQNGISIVIPAYNEEKFLVQTLSAAQVACKEFSSSFGFPTEIVVVNNASSDHTEKVAKDNGAIVINHEIRNISSVRNVGIKNANYNLIVTIDADCSLPSNALIEIQNLMDTGKYIGGALGLKVKSDSLKVKLGAFLIQNLVVRISGIYGAMFFFWKDEALKIGGFPENRLIAEDSAFAIALRKHGEKSNLKFARLKGVEVTTVDRKDNSWKSVFLATRQVYHAFIGAKQKFEDLEYWYKPNR